MTVKAGTIESEILFNTKDVKAGVKRVESELRQLKKDFKGLAKTVGSVTKSFVKWGAASAAAATTASAVIVKSTLSSIKELKAQATAAGLSAKELQRGAFAAEQFGVEQDKYADILKDVNDRLGDFNSVAGGEFKDFFDKIAPKVGVTAEAFKGLNSEQALGLYIKSLQQANLSQAEMTFFMEKIASDSTRLIPLFKDNSKQLKVLKGEAEALGIGLEEIDVAQAIEANKQLSIAAKLIKGQITEAVIELAPTIAAASEMFQDFVKQSGGIKKFVMPLLKNVAKGFVQLGSSIDSIAKIFKFLEITGRGVLGAILFVVDTMAKAISKKINLIISGAATGIRSISSAIAFFSEEQSEAFANAAAKMNASQVNFSSGTEKLLNKNIAGIKKARDEFNKLGESKPSFEKIDEFFAELETKAAEVSARVAKKVEDAVSGNSGGEENKDDKKPADEDLPLITFDKEAFNAQTEAMLESLRERNSWILEEDQMLRDKLLGQLELGLRNEIITQEQAEKIKQDIARKSADARNAIMSRSFKTVISALAENSKKALAIQKLYGAGEIVANTAKGIAQANSYPIPLNFIEMARVAAVGAIQLRNLKSASPGAGSISGGPGAGGGGGAAPPVQAPQPQGPQEASRIFNVDLTGSSNISAQQARNLLEVINEQAGDGVEINIRGAA